MPDTGADAKRRRQDRKVGIPDFQLELLDHRHQQDLQLIGLHPAMTSHRNYLWCSATAHQAHCERHWWRYGFHHQGGVLGVEGHQGVEVAPGDVGVKGLNPVRARDVDSSLLLSGGWGGCPPDFG